MAAAADMNVYLQLVFNIGNARRRNKIIAAGFYSP